MRETVSGRAGLASEAEVLDRVHDVLGPVDVAGDELQVHLGRKFRTLALQDLLHAHSRGTF